MNTFYQLYACYTYGVYPKYTQMRITLCILNIYTSSITAFFHSVPSHYLWLGLKKKEVHLPDCQRVHVVMGTRCTLVG